MRYIFFFNLIICNLTCAASFSGNDSAELRWSNFNESKIYKIEWQKEMSLINETKRVKNTEIMKAYWNAIKDLPSKKLEKTNKCKLKYVFIKVISQKESKFEGCTNSHEFDRILFAFKLFLDQSRLQN